MRSNQITRIAAGLVLATVVAACDGAGAPEVTDTSSPTATSTPVTPSRTITPTATITPTEKPTEDGGSARADIEGTLLLVDSMPATAIVTIERPGFQRLFTHLDFEADEPRDIHGNRLLGAVYAVDVGNGSHDLRVVEIEEATESLLLEAPADPGTRHVLLGTIVVTAPGFPGTPLVVYERARQASIEDGRLDLFAVRQDTGESLLLLGEAGWGWEGGYVGVDAVGDDRVLVTGYEEVFWSVRVAVLGGGGEAEYVDVASGNLGDGGPFVIEAVFGDDDGRTAALLLEHEEGGVEVQVLDLVEQADAASFPLDLPADARAEAIARIGGTVWVSIRGGDGRYLPAVWLDRVTASWVESDHVGLVRSNETIAVG